MVRILTLTLFISLAFSASAQTSTFNNTFQLQDGIYVTYQEMRKNEPSFPNCILSVNKNKDEIYIDELNYFIAGSDGTLIKYYPSQLFAMVLDGRLFIYYQKMLIPVYLKGTLCRFIYTREVTVNYNNNNRQTEFKSDICILDIQTGQIYKLSKDNLGKSIKRDPVLYASYAKIKPGKRDKNLVKYIADFNARNPTSIAIKKQPVIPEEE